MQPLDIHSLAQNYQPVAQAQPSGTARPGGLKGFLINNLPSIAGGIGLVGGEILDPFGGGLITGGALSGAGEALKEKLLGQKVDPKQVLIQAGETAALGGAGKVFSAVRTGGKAALGIASKTAAPAASDIAGTAAETVTKPTPTIGQKVTSAMINKGNQMESQLGGFATGQKVAGRQLTPSASTAIADTLDKEGISGAGKPAAQAAQVESKLSSINQARSSLMDVHNVPLAAEDKNQLTQMINERLSQEAGGSSENVQRWAKSFGNEALNQGDVSGLGKYKTTLDNNAINWSRNPASIEPGQGIAAKVVRGAIKDFVEQKVPGIAEINARATGLHSAQGALLNASGRIANLTNGGEGLWGRLLGGEEAAQVKGGIAKGLQKTGAMLGGDTAAATTEKVAPDLVSANGRMSGLSRQILGRTVAPTIAKPGAVIKKSAIQIAGRSLLNPTPPTDQSQQPAGLGFGTTADQTTTDSSANDPNDKYPQENMLYDIERDPTHASTYEAIYKQLHPAPTATQQTNDLNMATAKSGLTSISQAYDYAGGGQGAPGAATHIPILGQYLAPKAAAYNQTKIEVATQLAKALTGASRPAESVIMYYMHSLPNIEDRPEVAKYKLQILNNELQNRAKAGANIFGDANSQDTSSQVTDALNASNANGGQ